MARKAIDRARLTLAAMKRCVNGQVLPKGRADIAARFGREFAALANSTDGAEGIRAVKERRTPAR
jgi:enoyl-CoA hydratase/carnithine racemase